MGSTHLNSLVDVSVLQLHKPGRDGRDVRLLVAKSHAPGTLQHTQQRFYLAHRFNMMPAPFHE